MTKNTTDDGVTIVKTTGNNNSQQVTEQDEFKTIDGYIDAPDFKALEMLFDDSFLVPGILEKISSSVGSSFVTEKPELKKLLGKIDHDFLNMAREYFGSAYFEVIRTKGGAVSRLEPIITSTIRKLKFGGFVQRVGNKTAYFNEFIGDETERKKQIKIWEKTGATAKMLVTDKKPGYNANLNELYEFKNANITSKNYGHSKFVSTLDQILLLSTIDTYFLNLFGRGWMNTSIISPKDPKAKLTVNGKKVLQKFLLENFNGVKNAGTTAIIDVAIEKTDLADKVDTKAFNDKTDELFKKVAIGLNIPYEILLAVVGNKNTSAQAIENFNNHKIMPIQARNLKDFKIIFEGVDGIDDLIYEEIDLKDQLEEMKVITGYVKHGTISQEQARKEAGYEEPGKDDTFYSGSITPDETDATNSEDINKISEDYQNILKTIEKDVRTNI